MRAESSDIFRVTSRLVTGFGFAVFRETEWSLSVSHYFAV
jgi:hypothetical protein